MYHKSSCADLIYYLEEAIRKCDITEMSLIGSRVGIEAESVILRSVLPHAEDYLLKNNITHIYEQLLKDLDDLINYFRKFNVRLTFVFNGLKLPGLKDWYRKKSQLLLENRTWVETYRFEKKPVNLIAHCAVQVNHDLYKKVIDHCNQRKVDYLIAPYEAHAQLAYMSQKRLIDFVISDNVNTLILGSTRIILHLDMISNKCSLYEIDRLYKCFGVCQNNFKFSKFRWAVLLSGCDYLEHIDKSITFEMAYEFIFNPKYDKYENCSDLFRYLVHDFDDKKYLGLIKYEYIKKFQKAEEAMKYHLIYSPRTGLITPLEKYPSGHQSKDYPHAGKRIHWKHLKKIMTGNINLDHCHWQAFESESDQDDEESDLYDDAGSINTS